MRDITGRSGQIQVKDQIKGQILFYTIKRIIEVTDTHIFFIDKYDNELAFRIQDVIQLQLF